MTLFCRIKACFDDKTSCMQTFVMQHMYFGCLHDETCCMARLSRQVCGRVNQHIPKTFVFVDFKQNRFQTANHILII